MYPTLFGFLDSYSVMMVLAFAASFVMLGVFFKKKKFSKSQIIDLYLCLVVALIAGIVFATLFENVYEMIEYGKNYKFTFGMTFYGGLVGGVLGFVLTYLLYYKKHHEGCFDELLSAASVCVPLSHAIGRIGCFLAGCCYGKPTDSWIGMKFQTTSGKVIPTQLIECVFLFILFAVTLYFAYFRQFRYSIFIYLGAYAVFRFAIEYFRGDDRGAYIGPFSPSQFICLLIAFVLIPLLVVYYNKRKKKGAADAKQESL